MKKILFKRKNEKNNRYFTLTEDGLSYFDTTDPDEALYTSDYENVFVALDVFYDLKDKFEKICEEEITIVDADGNVLEDDPTEENLGQEDHLDAD